MNPQLLPRLGEIIDKSLEKSRDLRYQSAADLHTDLKRLKRDTESGVAIAQAAPPAALPVRPRSKLGIAALAALLILGLAAISLWRWNPLHRGSIGAIASGRTWWSCPFRPSQRRDRTMPTAAA